jgi:hypothetical protein
MEKQFEQPALSSSSFSASVERMLMRNLNYYVTLINEIFDFFKGTFSARLGGAE